MRLAALTLLALAATGCASHPPAVAPLAPAAREALFLTRNDLAPGRHCDIVDPGVPLPSIATVLDTAAMPDYLRQAGAAADSGYGLFSVRFDSTGKPVRARLIEATFADSLRQAMQQAVASSLLQRGPGAPLAARVRVDLGSTPAYRIGKSEYCQPVQLPPESSPKRMLDPDQSTVARSAEKVYYEIQVSPDGEVAAVRFVPSIAMELDQAVRPWLMAQRWKPALDDGQPVVSLVKGSRLLQMQVVPRPVPH